MKSAAVSYYNTDPDKQDKKKETRNKNYIEIYSSVTRHTG
jgi:hypothetical protein